MKRSRSQVKSKSYRIPKLLFEDQELTAFSGLVVFQALFAKLDLKARLRRCFRHWNSSASYRPEEVLVLLVIHLVLGFRRLREASFYRDEIVSRLAKSGVEFTVSVPFRRFPQLKEAIEQRRFWRRVNGEVAYLEKRWKPKSWNRRHRFVLVRTRTRQRTKEPLQLDLFEPVQYGFDFKVIVTNKTLSARKLVAYHDGRGSQEGLFAELKSQAQGDYIPVRTLAGNQVFFTSAILAHNLARELQMMAAAPERRTTEKRSALWRFRQLATLRRTILVRAGRLTRPGGALTLTMRPNPDAKNQTLQFLEALGVAA